MTSSMCYWLMPWATFLICIADNIRLTNSNQAQAGPMNLAERFVNYEHQLIYLNLSQLNLELVLLTDELAQHCAVCWLQNQMCGQAVINLHLAEKGRQAAVMQFYKMFWVWSSFRCYDQINVFPLQFMISQQETITKKVYETFWD